MCEKCKEYKNDTHTPKELFIKPRGAYINGEFMKPNINCRYSIDWCIFDTYEYKRVGDIMKIRFNKVDKYDKKILDELKEIYYTEIIYKGRRRRGFMMSNYITYFKTKGTFYYFYSNALDNTTNKNKIEKINKEYKDIMDELNKALNYHKDLTKKRNRAKRMEKIKCDLCGKLFSRRYMSRHKKKCKEQK